MRAVALELDRLDTETARVNFGGGAGWRRRGGPPRAAAPERLLPKVRSGLARAVLAREALPLLLHVVLEARPLERPLALRCSEGLASDGEQDIPRGPAIDRLTLYHDRPHGRLHEPDDAVTRDVVAPRLERMQRGQHEGGLGRGVGGTAREAHHQGNFCES